MAEQWWQAVHNTSITQATLNKGLPMGYTVSSRRNLYPANKQLEAGTDMLDTSDSLLKQNKLTLRVATYGGFEVQRENQNYKNYGGNFGGRQVAKSINYLKPTETPPQNHCLVLLSKSKRKFCKSCVPFRTLQFM